MLNLIGFSNINIVTHYYDFQIIAVMYSAEVGYYIVLRQDSVLSWEGLSRSVVMVGLRWTSAVD